MKKNFEQSQEMTKEIMKIISQYGIDGDSNQLMIQILPIISNGIFERDKKLLEKERFETLITLARVLDNENIESVIKALKYQLTIK